MKKKAELIFIPSPAVGHLVSTIEFAKRLIDEDDRIQITVLLMRLPGARQVDAYTRSLAASQLGIHLVDLPELQDPPSRELLKKSVESYVYAFVVKNIPLVRNSIKTILSSHDPDVVRVVGLFLDFFCLPMIDAANEVSLPSYVFSTCNTGFLALMQYLTERDREIGSVFENNCDDELLVPGFLSRVPVRVLPSGLFEKGGYEAFVKLAQRVLDAKGILVNTFSELETHYLNRFVLEQNFFPPVYPIGPVLDLKAHPYPALDQTQRKEVIKWLDDQPDSSVVFLCFGSMGSFEGSQVKEMACGLELSGCRFLWSLRAHPQTNEGPEDLLPEGFLSRVAGRGMICGWAPQVEVLAHKAVGGFVSHCGWNSILESLWFGVPIVTWPLYAEQQLNAFQMVKELGLAVELRLDYRIDGGEIVKAGEIERAVTCLMESDNAVRKRVKEMSEMARKSVTGGGSSFIATKQFIQDSLGSSI